jgi:RsiW-degrading membrane proteinase PrsW (M82 family)
MPFLIAVLLSFVPALIYAAIVYWLDRFEKEPLRLLIGAFSWGAFVATLGAIIWGSVLQLGLEIFIDDPFLIDLTGAALVAPVVEETLKGLAVALIFLAFPQEFDSILDGMVYGAITALGFAATENVLYLYFGGYAADGYPAMIALFVLRVILGGWGHAVYTAFIGIGLAVARLNRHWPIKVIAPLLGWAVAVFLHALHNAMATVLAGSLGGLVATLLVDWTSWLVVFGIVIGEILRERRWMRIYLREEVDLGTINAEHYRTATSIRGQARARMRGKTWRRFYEACAELAQKKHQMATLGEERGNSARIAALRAQLRLLAPSVGAA